MSLSPTLRRRGLVATAIAAVIVAVAAGEPLAFAAESEGHTVLAQLGSDGSVTKVTGLGGATAPAAKDLPITLKISAKQGGSLITGDQLGKTNGTINLSYSVANTTGKQKDIAYNDAKGAPQSVQAEVQVPYVAQLDVILGKGWSGVHAPNAAITSMPDGSLDVRWSLVLFAPLGSPLQTLSMSAASTGKSAPVATLAARVVNPVAEPGLGSAQVDANGTVAQNGLLGNYADGAKSGLDQLAQGASSLLAGLTQLAEGAEDLHSGLVEGQSGTDKLAQGLHNTSGQPDLLGGSKQLASGVQLISSGLNQLGNTTTGLPAAVAGVNLLSQGVNQLLAGLGSPSVPGPTVRAGVAGAQAGVDLLSAGVTKEKAGLTCAQKAIGDVVHGVAAGVDPCYVNAANPGGLRPGQTGVLDASQALVLNGVIAGIGTSADHTDTTLLGGLNLIGGGLSNPLCVLSNPTNPANPCGLKEALGLVQGGLGQIVGGLSNPLCVPANPSDPANPCGVAQGLASLKSGLDAAVAGIGQLAAGSASAATGAGALAAGLGQESAGLDQLAAGLPAATDGSGQIADGLNQVIEGAKQLSAGQLQVRDAAVIPIAQSLAQGGGNASATVAVLTAVSAASASPPLGTGTMLLMSQSDGSGGWSAGTWWTIAIAAGTLLVGLVGGLLIGRGGRGGRARFEHAA